MVFAYSILLLWEKKLQGNAFSGTLFVLNSIDFLAFNLSSTCFGFFEGHILPNILFWYVKQKIPWNLPMKRDRDREEVREVG